MMRRTVLMAAAMLAAFAMMFWLTPELGALSDQAGPLGAHLDLVVGNDGETTGLACLTPEDCTLRSAVNLANANGGDTDITFTAGTHVITLTGALSLNQPDIHVHGSYGEVKVGANGAGQAFIISGSGDILENLVIYGAGAGSANVWITDSAVGVHVAHSIIGPFSTLDAGCEASPNAHSGIYISSTGGALGGGARAYLYGLHIRRNGYCSSEALPGPGDGIVLFNTDNVVIGADASGNAGPYQQVGIFRNGRNGILVIGGSNNTIRNVDVQFNRNSGIVIQGSHANSLMGIGTWQNENSGVELRDGSYANEIGCTLGGGDASARNRIIGNLREGLYIAGAATRQNYVFCNEITGNSINGVVLTDGAYENHVGLAAAERNLISGNGNDGVQIVNGAHDNEIQGHFIGTNISGTSAYANAASGIAIYAGAHNNLVGGQTLGNANTIAGNGVYGIYIADADTATNTVQVNVVGTSSSYALPNGSDGITIQGGAHDNVIAGYGSVFTWVEFNSGSGIYIDNSPRNRIEKASVGHNGYYGVILSGSQTSQTVLSSVYADYCGLDGVGERNGAGNNTWTRLLSRGNGGMGIDRDASSDGANIPTPPYPTVDRVAWATGAIYGTAGATVVPFFGSTVEVYRASAERNGFAQSDWYVGSAGTDASGNWVVTDTNIATGGGCYVAFDTSSGIGLFGAYSYSTELSPSNCRTFLPLVVRNN